MSRLAEHEKTILREQKEKFMNSIQKFEGKFSYFDEKRDSIKKENIK